MEYVKFSVVDYALFVIMFGLSGAVGVYFGCFGKQDSTSEYLHGGKKMKVFPVAMSMVASTISGISLLGIPAEIYMHGTQYCLMTLSILLLGFAVNYIYLPVFYGLQLTSIFEYLEVRFSKKVRNLTSTIFTLSNLISLPIIIYAPSLAFNQVTGFDLHIIAPIMSVICIFYTTIGGIKAVVWTDTLQFLVTLCTLGCVLIMGTISVGGLSVIWEKSGETDRLEFFNMDLDPTVRSTFWNIVIGNFFFWTFFIACSQGIVQRFMAVPTFKDSQKILVIFVTFTIITKLINCFSGLIMFAKYSDCDPLSAGIIKKPDQIVPYYVLDVATQIPGLSGLFVAGLFSTALSTLSTYLNALAGVIYEDFVAPFMPKNTTEKKASAIMKIITLVTGIVSVALIFVVEKLGSILQIALSLGGITGGPIFGVFTIGMLLPMVNAKGALSGVLGSLIFMTFVVVKNQYLIWNGTLEIRTKPFYTHGCNLTTVLFQNETLSTTTTTTPEPSCPEDEPFWLFRVSFYYYLLMGTLVNLVISVIVSWIARDLKGQSVNPDHFSPCVRRFIRKSSFEYVNNEKELHVINVKEVECDRSTLDKLLK